MKKKKYEDLTLETAIINLLVYENTILRKKQNNEELSKQEKIFDNYIISPSFLIRHINNIERRKKNES